MKTSAGTLHGKAYLLFTLLISGALAACGGGGGSSTTSGTSGPATVKVSIASAPATGAGAAPVTVAGGGTVPTSDPGFQWPEEIKGLGPEIGQVTMDVVKISLMRAGDAFEGEDMDGEINSGNAPDPAASPDNPRFVTVVPETPVPIDLLHLGNGEQMANILNEFGNVPVGAYDKIRVYYRNVKVVLKDGSELRFHPTAHSKFDIHFRQGHELVIPAATDTTQPDGWVKVFRVELNVVGLKLKIVGGGNNWRGAKVILRPQIFAEFVPPILYSVAGTASSVSSVATLPVSGTFDISFGTGPGYPRIIHAAFDNDSTWAYSDDVLGNSSWIVDVLNTTAVPAFRNRAIVKAIGSFDSSWTYLNATDIVFTFPDLKSGVVDNGWRADNTFLLRSTVDNVVVFPMPDRFTAYYDNGTFPHPPLTQAAVDNNVPVTVRGYNVTGGIEAFWITAGEITVGP
ncbi:MAG: hypothetical protein WC899_08740 [bacterium]